MSSTAVLAPDRRTDLWFFLGILLVGVAVGAVGSAQPRLGLALLILAAGACLVAARPVLAAVCAVPAVYGYQGIGLGSLGASDVLLIGGALLALPALSGTQALRAVAPINRAFALYLALLVPSLLAHPSPAAATELVHRLIIVAGAVLTGAWILAEDRVGLALRLLAAASAFFALAAVITWLTNGHQAAYPFGYHKNYVGSLLALGLLLFLCAPRQLKIKPPLFFALQGLVVLGLLASESRGAILGAALGGFLWLFSPRESYNVRGRSRVAAAVLAVGFAIFAGQSVQQQLTSGDVATNSVGVRREVEAYTRELWRTDPVVGVGIRYFTSGEYGQLAQQPNNAIDNELAEAGLVGTVGFVVFHVVVLRLLWQRRRDSLGLAALALFSGQLLHGQFDIYWSSGVTPLPFLLVGMALASPIEVTTRAQQHVGARRA